MLEAHAFGHLVAHLLADQLAQQLVGVGEGGGRTLGSGDVAIDGDEVGGIGGSLKSLFETRIARGALALKESERSQNHGGGSADGAHLAAGGHLVADGLADTDVGIEVGSAGHAAGQHQQVGIREVALVELQVGLDGDAVGRLHQREVRCAHRYYLYAATAQHVNRDESLDILEAVSQEYINFCHNLFFFSWKISIFAAQR